MVMRAATISTFPKWMRKMSGFNQSWATRLLVRPLVKISARLATPLPIKLRVLKLISPATFAVVKPALTGEEPINPVVLTPAEARAKYGRLRLARRACPQGSRMTARARQPRLSREVRREQVLDAALEIIVEDGYCRRVDGGDRATRRHRQACRLQRLR